MGLGDAVEYLLPESDGRLLPCPGGAPANVAVGIARLGGISGFIGRVGDDPFGALMQRMLLTEGVDITYLKQDEWHRTSTVLVDLNDQGNVHLRLWSAPVPIFFRDDRLALLATWRMVTSLFNCVVCRAFAYQRIYCDDGNPACRRFCQLQS
ncbi:PfkB family carbohydrate kinase [Escherichia coli]